VGTQIGDVYSVDPVAMAVIHRYLGSEIGPSGYPTSSVQVLADGRLALVGGSLSFNQPIASGVISITWNYSISPDLTKSRNLIRDLGVN
jgi:hypothetical protein